MVKIKIKGDNMELGKIYIRSVVGIISICTMVSYLGCTDSMPEILAAIVALVYIDKNISE